MKCLAYAALNHAGDGATAPASGDTRSAAGEVNPAEDPADPGLALDGSAILPESVVRPVRAEFYGFEAQGKWRLLEAGGDRLDGSLYADYVRAKNSESGRPLPRIAPLRAGGGLAWTSGPWDARLAIAHAFRQARTADNELPTDAYTLVGAALSYRLKLQSATLEAFVKASNLREREARLHTSFLKDVAPLGGRALVAGIRAAF